MERPGISRRIRFLAHYLPDEIQIGNCESKESVMTRLGLMCIGVVLFAVGCGPQEQALQID